MFHRLDFGKTNDLHFLKLNQEEKEALLKYFLKKRNEANEPVCVCAQLDLILCDPMYYSLPGSSVHGIFQARLLEWVAIPSSRESSQPRDQAPVSCISCIGRCILYHFTTWEIHSMGFNKYMMSYIHNCMILTVRTGHGTTDWFQIGKGVRQGCILSSCLFHLYAEYIMRNAGLEEAQAGIKLSYPDR